MRHLTLEEACELHRLVVAQSGGGSGLRDMGALQSAVAQPKATFDRQDLYRTLAEKAAALGHSIIQNHPFVDGNKRAGHSAMETLLVLNGYELDATVDEQERVILAVAGGQIARDALAVWVEEHLRPYTIKGNS